MESPQRKLDEYIVQLEKEGRVPTLLLHSCCAPCSSYVIEYLSKYFEITVFYYNPNIFPKEEYDFRKEEQKRFLTLFPADHPLSFMDCDYESEVFYDAVKGLENEPERGSRCSVCFKLRLERTAREAAAADFDHFATTLTISPQKNSALLNEIGRAAAESFGSDYLESDFKKKNGYLRSTQLSKEYGMYRQDFCGCEFSRRS